MYRTASFVTVQEHFIPYCRCREAVKLFRFLLPPYSLIGTCNSVQNCTPRRPVEMWSGDKICILFYAVAVLRSLRTPGLISGVFFGPYAYALIFSCGPRIFLESEVVKRYVLAK
jgi:hypothetical protein